MKRMKPLMFEETTTKMRPPRECLESEDCSSREQRKRKRMEAKLLI